MPMSGTHVNQASFCSCTWSCCVELQSDCVQSDPPGLPRRFFFAKARPDMRKLLILIMESACASCVSGHG